MILVGLCVVGFLVSLLWVFLQRRGNGFSLMYTRLGREVEKSLLASKGPFQAAEDHRNTLKGITALVQTHRVLVVVPCLSVLLFVVLAILSVLA